MSWFDWYLIISRIYIATGILYFMSWFAIISFVEARIPNAPKISRWGLFKNSIIWPYHGWQVYSKWIEVKKQRGKR